MRYLRITEWMCEIPPPFPLRVLSNCFLITRFRWVNTSFPHGILLSELLKGLNYHYTDRKRKLSFLHVVGIHMSSDVDGSSGGASRHQRSQQIRQIHRGHCCSVASRLFLRSRWDRVPRSYHVRLILRRLHHTYVVGNTAQRTFQLGQPNLMTYKNMNQFSSERLVFP